MAPPGPTSVSIYVSISTYSVTWSGSGSYDSWEINIYSSATETGTYNLIVTNVVSTPSVTGTTAGVATTSPDPINGYWYIARVRSLSPGIPSTLSSQATCTPVQYYDGTPVCSTTNITMTNISTVFGGGLHLGSYSSFTNFEPCTYGILSTSARMGYFRGQSVLQPPSSVTLSSLSATGGTLLWTAPTVSSLTGYIYSIGTTAGGTDITNSSTFNSSSPLTFLATLTGGTNYYAVMKSKNSGGGISKYSAASAAASFTAATTKFTSATDSATSSPATGVGTATITGTYYDLNSTNSPWMITGYFNNVDTGNIAFVFDTNGAHTDSGQLIVQIIVNLNTDLSADMSPYSDGTPPYFDGSIGPYIGSNISFKVNIYVNSGFFKVSQVDYSLTLS